VLSIAKIWGGGGPPDDFGLLLPFPPEDKAFAGGKGMTVSPATAKAFFALITKGKIPKWVAGDLVRHTVQWKAIANGGG
jgi:hypothetical protein